MTKDLFSAATDCLSQFNSALKVKSSGLNGVFEAIPFTFDIYIALEVGFYNKHFFISILTQNWLQARHVKVAAAACLLILMYLWLASHCSLWSSVVV